MFTKFHASCSQGNCFYRSRLSAQFVPVLNHGISVLSGNLVFVFGIPDTKQHAAKVPGVVEESPAKQHSECVEYNYTFHASVGRERVGNNLVNECNTEPRVWIGHSDNSDQGHDGAWSPDWRHHTRSGNLVCKARKTRYDSGGEVGRKKLLSAELGGNNWCKRPQDVHVDEQMKQTVVTECRQQHWPTSRLRHWTCHKILYHELGELWRAPRQENYNIHADDAAHKFLGRIQVIPPCIQFVSEIPSLAVKAVIPSFGKLALLLLGELSKALVLPDRRAGKTNGSHGNGECERL